jgi:hypothetical protein
MQIQLSTSLTEFLPMNLTGTNFAFATLWLPCHPVLCSFLFHYTLRILHSSLFPHSFHIFTDHSLRYQLSHFIPDMVPKNLCSTHDWSHQTIMERMWPQTTITRTKMVSEYQIRSVYRWPWTQLCIYVCHSLVTKKASGLHVNGTIHQNILRQTLLFPDSPAQTLNPP